MRNVKFIYFFILAGFILQFCAKKGESELNQKSNSFKVSAEMQTNLNNLKNKGKTGIILQQMAIQRAEGIAPHNRPYSFDGIGDCYGFVRQIWNAILYDANIHSEDFYPNSYNKGRWHGVSGGLPVGTAPDSDWIAITDINQLLPGDILATHQGHAWGAQWHGGIYAGKVNGQNAQWDSSELVDFNGNYPSGAYKRPFWNGFKYYYKPIHDLLVEVTAEPCKTCTPKKTNGRLLPGEYLDKGQSITSSDGKTILIHQTDGNVVQYDQYGWLWQTGTSGKTTTRFIMQTDGNLVLYNGNTPLWSSGTYNNTNAYFDIQGDCNLVIYKSNGSPLWATYKFCRNFPNGTYQIAAGHSGKCLDVAGFSTADGGNIQQYSCSGGNNQKWNITAAGNGYYKISSVHSGKCMDLAAFSTANGGNIQQWSCSNADNQLWMLQPVGTNRYKLMAKSSKKVADVEGISTADLANVYQWDTTGACNQQWLFTAR